MLAHYLHPSPIALGHHHHLCMFHAMGSDNPCQRPTLWMLPQALHVFVYQIALICFVPVANIVCLLLGANM